MAFELNLRSLLSCSGLRLHVSLGQALPEVSAFSRGARLTRLGRAHPGKAREIGVSKVFQGNKTQHEDDEDELS